MTGERLHTGTPGTIRWERDGSNYRRVWITQLSGAAYTVGYRPWMRGEPARGMYWACDGKSSAAIEIPRRKLAGMIRDRRSRGYLCIRCGE